MSFSRRPGSRFSRGRISRPTKQQQELEEEPLIGTGPTITVTGTAPLPLSLSVLVTFGALGVGLVTCIANGITLLNEVLSQATLNLSGSLSGCHLSLSAGLYLGNTYTLELP